MKDPMSSCRFIRRDGCDGFGLPSILHRGQYLSAATSLDAPGLYSGSPAAAKVAQAGDKPCASHMPGRYARVALVLHRRCPLVLLLYSSYMALVLLLFFASVHGGSLDGARDLGPPQRHPVPSLLDASRTCFVSSGPQKSHCPHPGRFDPLKGHPSHSWPSFCHQLNWHALFRPCNSPPPRVKRAR